MFITFEGVEGSGKSTQATRLATFLQEQGYRVVLTREPGGTTLSDKIRNILLANENKSMVYKTEVLLYMASRAQHTEELILSSLKEGKIVICDRYIDSSLAYQGYARGIGEKNIEFLNEFATNGLKPDVTILIDIDPEISLRRIGTEKDRIESESLEFHKKVREGYLRIAGKEPNRVKIIDGNKTKEEIFEEVKKIVISLLKEKNHAKG